MTCADDYKRHGGPCDRGSADRYYNQPFEPHYFAGPTFASHRFSAQYMTPAELAAYRHGWDQETSRKDWGRDDAPEPQEGETWDI